MARSNISNTSVDAISDAGAILLSYIKGEQLEFPIKLDFLLHATNSYVYEAVVLEALNIPGNLSVPLDIKPNGVQTNLNVRLPNFIGEWVGTQGYNKNEIVRYNNVYYVLNYGVNRINSTAPNLDNAWSITSLDIVHIRFPSSLGDSWEVQPTVQQAVYGFFELRVTEPVTESFRKTWKPARGMIELLFSPTEIVPDV